MVTQMLTPYCYSRRSTFEGGSKGLQDLLDSSDLFEKDHKSKRTPNRRETVNLNELDALWNDLDSDNDLSPMRSVNASPAQSIRSPNLRSQKSKSPAKNVKVYGQSNKKSKAEMSSTPIEMKENLSQNLSPSIDSDLSKMRSTTNRRMTANISDIASLLDGLDQSSGNIAVGFGLNVPHNYVSLSDNQNTPSRNDLLQSDDKRSKIHGDKRRQTVNASALEDLMNTLNSSKDKAKSTDESSRFSFISSSDAASSPFNRRETADPRSLKELINDSYVSDDKPFSSKVMGKDSRQTVGSVDIFDLLSDSSRISAEKAPNTRRETADPIYAKSLLNNLSNSDNSIENKDDDRRMTLNASAMDDLLNMSSISTDKPFSVPVHENKAKDSDKRPEKRSSRRTTAEPLAIEKYLDTLDDDTSDNISKKKGAKSSDLSSKKKRKPRNSLGSNASNSGKKSSRRQSKDNRRMTADPADMAALLQGLDDDERSNSLSYAHSNSLGDMMPTGRESVDTLALIKSVTGLLNENRLNDSKSEISDLIDLNDSVSRPSSAFSEARDNDMDISTDTVNTLDLMTNIKSALGDEYHVKKDDDSSMMEMSEDRFDFNQSSHVSPKRHPDISISMPQSALKGILSCRKEGSRKSIVPASSRKTVNFGSPAAAEFNKTSPTTNFTPLDKEQAKAYFPQHFTSDGSNHNDSSSDEDEITAGNSQILDEWDRLTNTSGISSESDEVIFPEHLEGLSNDTDSSSIKSVSDKKRRKSIDSNSSKRAKRRKSSILKPFKDVNYHEEENLNDISAIETSDNSFTVALPGNLMVLMAEADEYMEDKMPENLPSNITNEDPSMLDDEGTQELEGNLQSMLRHIDYDQHSITIESDISISTAGSDIGSHLMASHVSYSSDSSRQSSNKSLGPLLGLSIASKDLMVDEGNTSGNASRSSDVSKGSTPSPAFRSFRPKEVSLDESITVQLENRLTDILDSNAIAEKESIVSHMEEDHTETLEHDINQLVNKYVPSEEPVEEESDYDIDSKHTNNIQESIASNSMQVIDEEDEASSMASVAAILPTDHFVDVYIGSNATSESYILDTSSLNHQKPTDSSTSEAVKTLKERLKTLNEGARKNALTQCSSTPLPSHRSRSRVLNDLSTLKAMAPQPALGTVSNGSIESATKPVKPNPPKRAISLVDILNQAQLNHIDDITYHNTQNSQSLLRQIVSSSSMKSDSNADHSESLKRIFSDLMKSAYTEGVSQLYNNLSINILQSHVQEKLNKKSMDDIEGNLMNLRPQVDELACFNWSLWEAKLSDIASGAIRRQNDDLRKKLETLRASNDQLERDLHHQISSGHEASSNGYKSDIDTYNIDTTSQKLVKAQELELSLRETQRSIQLINRLTYCQIKSLSSSNIHIDAIFSSTFRANIAFHMSHDGSIHNIEVDILTSGKSQEDALATAYFANIMADNSLYGPLSSFALSAVERASQIPAVITRVSYSSR